MKRIPNFVGGSPIDVHTTQSKEYGVLVSISQFGGAMHFQHSMTALQAFSLADALIEAAGALAPEAFPTIEHHEAPNAS